jgi:hypothetical protein
VKILKCGNFKKENQRTVKRRKSHRLWLMELLKLKCLATKVERDSNEPQLEF